MLEGLRFRGHLGGSQNQGYRFGCPHNKDDNILESTLGYPSFGKLPCIPEASLYPHIGVHGPNIGYFECNKGRSRWRV